MKMWLLILFGIAVVVSCKALWNINPYLYIVALLLLFLFVRLKKPNTKITLIDMYHQGGKYTYIYLANTNNKIDKVEFISDIPHLWWTEIDKMLLKENCDLTTVSALDKPVELKYGNISVCKFSEKEKQKYNNFRDIKALLNGAVDKQAAFSEAYNEKYGHPDLRDLHKNSF